MEANRKGTKIAVLSLRGEMYCLVQLVEAAPGVLVAIFGGVRGLVAGLIPWPSRPRKGKRKWLTTVRKGAPAAL